MMNDPLLADDLPTLLRWQMAVAYESVPVNKVAKLTRVPYSPQALHSYLNGAVRPQLATLRDLLGRLRAPGPVIARAIELWEAAEMASAPKGVA